VKERAFIEWIRAQNEWDREDIVVGPGDDCAILRCGDQLLAVTTDQILDGVHVTLAADGPYWAGRKAMARNLSDIAAMAAEPLWACATVAMPRGFSEEDAKQMYKGRRAISDEMGCPMIGGDVGSWDGPLAISVTICGRVGEHGYILRSGARPGDALCVTGSLGGAWRSNRHLRFTPRIAEALLLARRYHPTAMIDLSDGLSTDLGHICTASGCGAEIQASAVPCAMGAGGDVDPLTAALNDGEDYELLFALGPEDADRLLADQPLAPVTVTRIGQCTDEGGPVLLDPDGRPAPLTPAGWEHETHESP
jgi:thiamine-monophosphate kinase